MHFAKKKCASFSLSLFLRVRGTLVGRFDCGVVLSTSESTIFNRPKQQSKHTISTVPELSRAPGFTLYIGFRDWYSTLSKLTILLYKPDAIYCSHNLRSRAISVETKLQSRSRRKHHHTYTCFSCRQREKTNKRLHEVDDLSEVPSPNTSRTIDKDNKIHTRSAN